eukprot:CAMPEP_0197433816 /NCGR_PEP_ID=MMETSP1175-20131217/1625_1 /TAXON_ID=1003142 /ORGANISM="Triceratium dubium, Strain CCMP147" /LENGTH=42 /DNA_ID= /DNA_START= /DNA_END= /DNA_ORIENTATION=
MTCNVAVMARVPGKGLSGELCGEDVVDSSSKTIGSEEDISTA